MKSIEADSLTSMLPAERRAVGVIALIGVLRMFGLFALLPVLALHAATLEGATPLLIGMAVGAYGLTQAGMQIPLGVVLNVSPKVFINAGYTLNWLWSNDALTNDMMHSFVAGLGFKLNG